MSKVRHYTPEHHLLSCKDWRCFEEVIRATTLFFHYLLKQLLLFSYRFFLNSAYGLLKHIRITLLAPWKAAIQGTGEHT